MVWTWWLFTGFVIVLIFSLNRGMKSDYYNNLPVIGSFVSGVGVLMSLVFSLILTIQPPYDRGICNKFHNQTGYTTKFVRYNTWSWDCLIKTNNGRWVSKDNLIGIAPANGDNK